MNTNFLSLGTLALAGSLTSSLAQSLTLENFTLPPSGKPTLDFLDPTGTSSDLYELSVSTDLTNWALVNYCTTDGSLTTVTMPKSDHEKAFYQMKKVDLTIGGTVGSSYALGDHSFPDSGTPDPDLIELGKLLFWDKELSGNRNISCSTCHHTDLGSGDNLSLPIGEGGSGIGILRTTGAGLDAVVERVPRNAPHLFSMGANDITTIFHDGRLSPDPSLPNGFQNPAGANLPTGLTSPLAAQAMFPVTSATEMAGQAGENDIADFSAAGNLPGLWNALALRLQAIPGYVTRFQNVFPDVVNAFEAHAFRSDNSPFDNFLRGDSLALDEDQLSGLGLFYGKAGCAECHSGVFQTDQSFHAIAMPQIGPGKGHGLSGHEDWGLGAETGLTEDRFKFRTPTLRNVSETAPYGHAGAYATLEAVVRHHLDPVTSLHNYDDSQLVLPSRPDLDLIDTAVMNDLVTRQAIADANELAPVSLSETEIQQVLAFLGALTDPDTLDLSAQRPATVPSGLPVD